MAGGAVSVDGPEPVSEGAVVAVVDDFVPSLCNKGRNSNQPNAASASSESTTITGAMRDFCGSSSSSKYRRSREAWSVPRFLPIYRLNAQRTSGGWLFGR